MSFDLNILVNGSRCKQYHHQGKTFIEAKEGSEYVIEIKNHHSKRTLAVGSVDGLNILTGKPADEKDSGYIVGGYSVEKIKGFRYSDDEWAMFRFGYKFNGKTYAQSKNDGSERNCGVIGLRMFYEKEPIYTYATPTITWNTTPQWLTTTPVPTCVPSNIPTVINTNTSWMATASYSVSNNHATWATGAVNNTVNYCCSNLGTEDLLSDNTPYNALFGGTGIKSSGLTKGGDSSKMSKPRRSAGGGQSANVAAASAPKTSLISSNNNVGGLYGQARYGYTPDEVDWMECEKERSPDFDMGTEWGRKERSKVKNVPFERGCLAQSFDIYYASRESLIAMGVPITNELQVGLPQSFPSGYAQPPAGWVG